MDCHRPVVLCQYFQALPGQLISCLQWLVRVADTAYPYSSPLFFRYLSIKQICCVYLNINKFSPGLFMPGKPFHKTSIAIRAAMLTAHIWINDPIINLGCGEYGFYFYFFSNHISIIKKSPPSSFESWEILQIREVSVNQSLFAISRERLPAGDEAG